MKTVNWIKVAIETEFKVDGVQHRQEKIKKEGQETKQTETQQENF